MTLEADTNPVADTNVVLMNADKQITGTGTTDSTGQADGIEFRTIRIDASGTTNDDLAGYEAVTVAEIEYSTGSTNIGDFRYAFEGLSLSDASGNTGTIDLTDRIEARICYTYTSTSYTTVARCSGSNYLATGSSRDMSNGDGGTYKEYGYYGATAEDMSGKVIMVDTPFMYFDDGKKHNWNDTLVLITGSTIHLAHNVGMQRLVAMRLNCISTYRKSMVFQRTRQLVNRLVSHLDTSLWQWTSRLRTLL